MRRYTVQDLFSFRAALRDGPYGGCFSPYSPLFRRFQVAEGNLSALRHLPYQGRLSASTVPAKIPSPAYQGYGTSPIGGGFRLSS